MDRMGKIYWFRFKDPEISASASQALNPPASPNLFKLGCFGAATLIQILSAEIEISGSLKWNQYMPLIAMEILASLKQSR